MEGEIFSQRILILEMEYSALHVYYVCSRRRGIAFDLTIFLFVPDMVDFSKLIQYKWLFRGRGEN